MDNKKRKRWVPLSCFGVFVSLFLLFVILLTFSNPLYASTSEETVTIRLGEQKEEVVTLNDDEIASRKIEVTNGKKGKYKVKVETTLSDSYWKGSELELTSENESLFNGTFAALSETQTFTMANSSFTSSVTPSLEKGAAAEYKITYTITQGKDTAIVVLKYHPIRIKGLIYKGLLTCSTLLILVLIIKKLKDNRINHFSLKLSLLLLILVMSLFLTFDFGVGYMKDGSMSPDISENDLIISKAVSADSIEKGDIIVLRSSDNLQEIVEKVQKIDTTSMKVTTKNEEKDSLESESSVQKIQGKVLFTIPKIGKALSLIKITIT